MYIKSLQKQSRKAFYKITKCVITEGEKQKAKRKLFLTFQVSLNLKSFIFFHQIIKVLNEI